MSTPPLIPSTPSGTNQREVTFATKEIHPPTNLYVTIQDRIRIRCLLYIATGTLFFRARLLRGDGTIIDIAERFTATGANSIVKDVYLVEGYLLTAAFSTTDGPQQPGDWFCTASIVRGSTSTPEFHQTLISHYVIRHIPAAYPNTPLMHSLAGPGNIRTITGSDPAAGAEVSESVSAAAVWRLQAARWELTFSGTVCGRRSGIIIRGAGSVVIYQCRSDRTVNTGNAHVLCIAPHGQLGYAGPNHAFIPIPSDLRIPPGGGFESTSTNLQAGDNYAAPIYTVEEWVLLA